MPPDPNQGNYQPPPGGYQQPPPPPGGYQAPPPPGGYAGPGPGAVYQTPTGQALAEWPVRALGGLVDYFGGAILAIFVEVAISFTLGALLGLLNAGWALYNGYLNGQTGKSFGKQVAGTKLIHEETGQLIGGGNGVVRALAHIIDAIICYIGFLFPLWDPKKQTIADKIMKTVVVVG